MAYAEQSLGNLTSTTIMSGVGSELVLAFGKPLPSDNRNAYASSYFILRENDLDAAFFSSILAAV
jgi:hypothetical protein